MHLEINLWTILTIVITVVALVEYSTVKLVRRDAERKIADHRRDMLNKINNLPGDEAEYVRFMNAIWSALYDDPYGWDLPDQIIRHVHHLATKLDELDPEWRKNENHNRK